MWWLYNYNGCSVAHFFVSQSDRLTVKTSRTTWCTYINILYVTIRVIETVSETVSHNANRKNDNICCNNIIIIMVPVRSPHLYHMYIHLMCSSNNNFSHLFLYRKNAQFYSFPNVCFPKLFQKIVWVQKHTFHKHRTTNGWDKMLGQIM